MTIEEQITNRMKEAMRSKNQQELNALRMVKSQAQVTKSASGFDGKNDDTFWLEIIARYVKQQTRARAEFEQAGEAGQAQVTQLNFEIDYFNEFLPKKMSAEELRVIVKKAIADIGAEGPKMLGKVIGHVMKSHRESADPQLLKEIVTEELA